MLIPFHHGSPVPPEHFIGRGKELRRIINRIKKDGQSTAIIGEPKSGKTSLLLYLKALPLRQTHYDTHMERLLFSFLDVQTLGDQFSQTQFWEHALHPLLETSLAPAYQNCQEKGFELSALQRLLEQIHQARQCLVLMIDKFEALPNHPILNKAEFVGRLRSLISLSSGAISLLVASRLPLSTLNKQTTGSPYFNVFEEITLTPFSDKEKETLLSRAGEHFSQEDRRFLIKVAGAHPYLLQTTASALWNIYEDGETDPKQRLELAGQQLYENVELTLYDIWRVWTPMTRMAVMTIALAQMPQLLKKLNLSNASLLRDMVHFKPELRRLEKQGFILKDKDKPKWWRFKSNSSGWQIYPGVLLWWLADELNRAVRDEKAFEEWIRVQEWDGILTATQKQQLNQAGEAIAHSVIGAGIFEIIKMTVLSLF